MGLAWTSLVQRAAVIAGCLTALLALVRHVPVHVASLRGAYAWGAVLVVERLGRWLLQHTVPPADEGEGPPEQTGSHEPSE